MNAIATKTFYTIEDLLAMPDEKDYELMDGQLVERNMSTLSSWVGGEMLHYLSAHLKEDQLGWVFPADNGFQCFPHRPNRLIRADVSFVRRERLPQGLPSEGYLKIAPDLAVEVISPNDLAREIDQKVAEYLRAGVPLIWIIHPDLRAVRVHRSSGPVSWLREEEELSGEDILPGFRCRVAALFPPRAEGAGAEMATPEQP
jgi:Uma2 family endonuclease